jgi:YVTN family beta-propeller protein
MRFSAMPGAHGSALASIVLLVVLALPLQLGPGGVLPQQTGPPHPVATSLPPGAATFAMRSGGASDALPARPVASPGPGRTNATLCLFSDTLLPGNNASECLSGLDPYGAAFDSTNGDVYVTDAYSDTVSVISGTTNTVIATIPVGADPYGAVFDSTNGDIYVTNSGSTYVSVISGSTNTIVAEIPGELGLYGGTFDTSNGDVYVTDARAFPYVSDDVEVISGATNAVVAFIHVGSDPYSATFDPTNGDIYVTNSGSHNVSVISGATNQVVSSVPVGSSPWGVTYDSTTASVYAVNQGSDNVSVISTSTNKVVATVPVGSGPSGAAFDSTNGEIYVANNYGANVTVISGSTNKGVATVSVLNPLGEVFDPTNGEVYVTNSGQYSNKVSAISGTTNTVLENIPVSGAPLDVALDSTNGDLYVEIANSNFVYAVSGATDRVVATVQVGVGPEAAAFDSANGDVYVCNFDSGNVSVISGASNTVVASVPVGTGPDAAAFDSTNGDIYIANSYSNNATVISGASNTVVANLAVGGLPDGATFDTTNGDVYVTSGAAPPFGQNVTVISGSSNKVVANIGVGGTPAGPAFDPANGDVYVPDHTYDNASVISGATNMVVANIPLGSNPTWAAFNSANGDVYITDSLIGFSNVSVISGATNTVVATISTGVEPWGDAYDPTNGDVYAVDFTSEAASIIGPVTPPTLPSIAAFFPSPNPIEVGWSSSLNVTAWGGSGPLSYSFTGLPSGCTSTSVAALVCTPTVAGTFTVRVFANDTAGNSASSTTTLFVLPVPVGPTIASFSAVPSTILLGGTSDLTVSATGGVGPLNFAFAALPPGCSSSDVTSLACTPTASGSFLVRVYVNDSAGNTVSGAAMLTVTSGPPGMYTLTFFSHPDTCPITFNGTSQSSGSSNSFLAGSFAAVAPFCNYHWTFDQWNTTGGVSVLSSTQASTTATVSGAGTLTAYYVWAGPSPVTFYISPSQCGTIAINGSTYTSGSSANFMLGAYDVSVNPCNFYVFKQWNSTGGILVASPTSGYSGVTITGTATLTAWYVWSGVRNIAPRYTVKFYDTPSACPLMFNGSSQTNLTSVTFSAGNYSAFAPACQGYAFQTWDWGFGHLSGASNFNPDTIWVFANGTVNVTYWVSTTSQIPVSITLSSSASSVSAGDSVTLSPSILGGLAPFTCVWSLNGTNTSRTGCGAASIPFDHPGTYEYQVWTTDGQAAIAGSNLVTLTVTPTSTTGPPELEVFGNATITSYPSACGLGPAAMEVSFTSTARGGSPPYTFEWLPGDGRDANPGEQNATYGYTDLHDYNATVEVTDHSGAMASRVVPVVVPYPVINSCPPGYPPPQGSSGFSLFGLNLVSSLLVIVVALIGGAATVILLLRGQRKKESLPPREPASAPIVVDYAGPPAEPVPGPMGVDYPGPPQPPGT